MLAKSALASSLVAAACCSAAPATTTTNTTLPSLDVPACPSKGRISYNLTSPDRVAFPDTAVEICYDDSALRIDFLAYDETSFFYNSTYTTNGDIYNYEVMEVFIAEGTSDPQTYLEFEVAPNNVTFQVCNYLYLPTQFIPSKHLPRYLPTYIEPDLLRLLTQRALSLTHKKKPKKTGLHLQPLARPRGRSALRHVPDPLAH